MKRTLWMPLAMGFSILALSGCANHIRNEENTAQEVQKKVLSEKYEMRFTPSNFRNTSYYIEVEKLESAEIQKYEVKTVKSFSTPYQWWRKLYEMPASLGLLPASIGSHMLFVFSFGTFPYRIPQAINDLAFCGVNPFLNWEDEDRVEENLLKISRKMLSSGVENNKIPMSQKTIVIKTGSQSKNFKTDNFGSFTLDFLSLNQTNMFFPLSRKISFYLESDQKDELKHIILTRDFLACLLRARTKINVYRKNPSGRALFDTVIYLEKLGFEQLGYSLEETELSAHKNNAVFQKDFQAASQE